ncbi:hypothetical protein CBR_g50195 [Chara braunii]|uniref:DDE Tnp4 domain-containing protein n=1 Tax=Chara braunii TaxID=69332 RepID=A0A388M6J9_CHABU|nr:hypothetical protein CBR_g50195 [Chara braunii]|eukprot:GBG90103.1 hypothetical protein CBR_g50195 [Chara braunii]
MTALLQDGGPDLVYDHAMCMDSQRQLIYVFGGRNIFLNPGMAESLYSGLYVYDVQAGTWTQLRSDSVPVPDGGVPLKSRTGHSMLLDPNCRLLYIFAGQRNKDYLSDFYVYDIERDYVHQISQDSSRGVWEDLRQCDDATEDYFKDKLRMSPRVFREIAETLSPFLQRRVTFYREPLQPDLIVAFALYRWPSGETYESGTCSFGIGRKSGLVAVRNVTSALLSAYRDKISWPTGVQKAVVLCAFADKGFPNCHGCIDCTHIFIDKPSNCPGEDYYDRKRRFFVQAQVVVDLNLRVLDVFVGYPGSCHDVRIVHLSSLWARAEAGELFTGPPVMLPFGVRTNSYLLGDNGYPPSEWVVVPYGGVSQHPSEIRFDNK